MKMINKENKIKRLRWQIELIQEEIDNYEKGNKQMKEAIEKRERAIEYLKTRNADWEMLKDMFGFNYCQFNLNKNLVLFGPRRTTKK